MGNLEILILEHTLELLTRKLLVKQLYRQFGKTILKVLTNILGGAGQIFGQPGNTNFETAENYT